MSRGSSKRRKIRRKRPIRCYDYDKEGHVVR